MSQAISFTETMAANGFIAAQGDVADHQFNPCERRSRLSVYAKSSLVNGRMSFSVGSRQYLADDVLPVDVGTLSTRDHLVATGVAFKGEKITVGLRNTGAGAPVIDGRIVLQPIG